MTSLILPPEDLKDVGQENHALDETGNADAEGDRVKGHLQGKGDFPRSEEIASLRQSHMAPMLRN